ncbi:GntR family transcriptional regulator [Enterococcus sp. SMC-9]|uniref:GntR family transcriptional regulator n=1 Tax=Enterococcus sp. SMC-9 TaxID=2862343 RepID=UPI001E422E19|nr:LacI family DNA-binding transcriptional regulator [Enterococcus sp. SMC-9]MCD1024347.1 LacI family transcriptional regulator [Enterococcus sp. SMC-9]
MEPLYLKILRDLQADITSGLLAAGDQLPTEKELSEKYSVSRITSKRALNELEQKGLIERTRGKGSFVTGKLKTTAATNRVLILLPFTDDVAIGNLSGSVLPVMQHAQHELMIATYDFLNTHTPQDIKAEFDGLIYYTEAENQHLDLLFELSFADFPIVLLDKEVPDLSLPSFLSDNLAGGKKACDYLVKAGHKRIAYLFGDRHHPQSTRQRYLGYIQSLMEHQIDFHTSFEEDTTSEDHLLRYVKQNQITAFVCENDITAIQAMRTLRQAGLAIPQDISVVGFDNIQAAALVDPPLTTISQNFKAIGETAGEALLSWIKTGQKPNSQKIPVTLFVRESTKEIKS